MSKRLPTQCPWRTGRQFIMQISWVAIFKSEHRRLLLLLVTVDFPWGLAMWQALFFLHPLPHLPGVLRSIGGLFSAVVSRLEARHLCIMWAASPWTVWPLRIPPFHLAWISSNTYLEICPGHERPVKTQNVVSSTRFASIGVLFYKFDR